jgi:hypothetical protein
VHHDLCSKCLLLMILTFGLLLDFLNAVLVFGLETIKTREMYLSSLATSYTA